MKSILLSFIRLYQKTLSLDHGFLKFLKPYGQCKFYPTCSEYAYQAIKKYGPWLGATKALKRIFRCNPWTAGGVDV